MKCGSISATLPACAPPCLQHSSCHTTRHQCGVHTSIHRTQAVMATSTGDDGGDPEPRLEKARHIKYYTRCIKTLLPQQYTGNDSNRMYLGFLMVAGLDLLGALDQALPTDERQGFVGWIYRCQHPDGGFRMWPGTDFGDRRNEENAKWDPANVPATYFALAALLVLGDDLKRVRRRQTLKWIRQMQRPDGSFGETLVEGRIEGGMDPRFGYCASGARHILRGKASGPLNIDRDVIEDIDVDGLVRCILHAEAFDGGIADVPFGEPHAGYTFCSLGCLNFTNRLNSSSTASKYTPTNTLRAPSDPAALLHWLVHRQTDLIDPDAALDTEFIGRHTKTSYAPSTEANDPREPAHQSPTKTLATPSTFPSPTACLTSGMNGRTNKVADTCYCWWVGASLHLIGQPGLYDRVSLIRYLLGKTQHPVLGGFGKFPGDLPDLYHSYLGLATLSLIGCEGVKEVDPGMCISREATARLEGLWRGWAVA